MDIPAEPNGFDPSRDALSPSAFQIMKAVADPLTALDTDGNAKPYLAESVTANADFTEWRIKVRPDITFHDGAPLDAAAVKANLDDRIKGVVTKDAFLDIADGGVKVVDPLTVSVTMKRPWAHFDEALANQMGFMLSPQSFGSDEALASIAVKPVGTGPFVWDQWNRGENVATKRNPSYWQKDGRGGQLPYLDRVTFKFTPDPDTMINDLQNGNASAFLSTVPGMSQKAAQAGFAFSEEKTDGSELVAILNNGANSVFADKDLRIAAAEAIDRNDMNQVLYGGKLVPAEGPMAAESEWGAPTNNPTFNPEDARRRVEEAKAAGKDVDVQISAVQSVDNDRYTQYIQRKLSDVGFNVTVNSVPEKAFAVTLVTAGSDISMFNYYADPDPDMMWHLFSSQTAPDNGIGLNLGRWKNEAAEEALTTGRQTVDKSTRVEAYKQLWEQMGKDVPVLFLLHTPTTVGWANNVQDMAVFRFPDGSEGKPFVWGNGFLTRVWLKR